MDNNIRQPAPQSNPYTADDADSALAQAQYEGYLPRCVHDNSLMDWSGERLGPPCGCKLSFRDSGEELRYSKACADNRCSKCEFDANDCDCAHHFERE